MAQVHPFDAWLYGFEGFALRYERAIDEIRPRSPENLKTWLRAAYEIGRNTAQSELRQFADELNKNSTGTTPTEES